MEAALRRALDEERIDIVYRPTFSTFARAA